jgi:hypothetical protein
MMEPAGTAAGPSNFSSSNLAQNDMMETAITENYEFQPETQPTTSSSGVDINQTPQQQLPEFPTASNLSAYYRVVSQTVRISALDFDDQSFRVRTEISLVALNSAMAPVIALDLGRGFF